MTCPCGREVLCDDCVGSIHDPEVVTGRAAFEAIRLRDHAYAEAMDLEPDDFVDTDGTITRAHPRQMVLL